MSKKFTKKALVLRARSRRRKQSLKLNPPVFGRKTTLQEQNREVIKSLEAKMNS